MGLCVFCFKLCGCSWMFEGYVIAVLCVFLFKQYASRWLDVLVDVVLQDTDGVT